MFSYFSFLLLQPLVLILGATIHCPMFEACQKSGSACCQIVLLLLQPLILILYTTIHCPVFIIAVTYPYPWCYYTLPCVYYCSRLSLSLVLLYIALCLLLQPLILILGATIHCPVFEACQKSDSACCQIVLAFLKGPLFLINDFIYYK